MFAHRPALGTDAARRHGASAHRGGERSAEVAPELLELEDLRFDPRVNDAHLAFLAAT